MKKLHQRIFLGGTSGKISSPSYNRWREDKFIPMLVAKGIEKEYLFNPVVENWTDEVQRLEDAIKDDPETIMFYFISNPRTPGNEVSNYSLVELTMALYDNPRRTVAVFDVSENSPDIAKAIRKIISDLKQRFPHGFIFDSLEEAAIWLAEHFCKPHGTNP